MTAALPVVYLPHGGGPWPFTDTPMGDPAELSALAGYLRSLASLPSQPPRAILVVSAHWEEPLPTVMTSAHPPLLFDYYGFPPETYALTWPAPGAPELASRVRELLASAGISSAEEPHRGFDHGTFVPLKLTFPEAQIPTLQLSLQSGLDPEKHLALGRALAPLRSEGVFILGSGMSYHNMRGFRPGQSPSAHSLAFDQWLSETISLESSQRDTRLSHWATAPSARACHPREEHLLPLMVVAGAAGTDRGRVGWSGDLMGVKISGFHFG